MASSSSDSEFENTRVAGGASSKVVLDVEAVHLALTSDPVSDSSEYVQRGSHSVSASPCDSPMHPAPLPQSVEVSHHATRGTIINSNTSLAAHGVHVYVFTIRYKHINFACTKFHTCRLVHTLGIVKPMAERRCMMQMMFVIFLIILRLMIA